MKQRGSLLEHTSFTRVAEEAYVYRSRRQPSAAHTADRDSTASKLQLSICQPWNPGKGPFQKVPQLVSWTTCAISQSDMLSPVDMSIGQSPAGQDCTGSHACTVLDCLRDSSSKACRCTQLTTVHLSRSTESQGCQTKCTAIIGSSVQETTQARRALTCSAHVISGFLRRCACKC